MQFVEQGTDFETFLKTISVQSHANMLRDVCLPDEKGVGKTTRQLLCQTSGSRDSLEFLLDLGLVERGKNIEKTNKETFSWVITKYGQKIKPYVYNLTEALGELSLTELFGMPHSKGVPPYYVVSEILLQLYDSDMTLASFENAILNLVIDSSRPSISAYRRHKKRLIGLGLIAKRNKVENGNSKKKVKKKEFLDKFLMDKKNRMVLLALFGFLIGLNAGAFGAGGGMMLLVVLIFVLGFGIHEAIGTSILIMVFLAFFGAVSHYYYHPFPTLFLIIAAIGGFFGARYSSVVANMISEKNLKLAAGVLLVVLGFLLALKSFFFSLSF